MSGVLQQIKFYIIEISGGSKETSTFSLFSSIMTFPELLITHSLCKPASFLHKSSCLRIVESPFPAGLYQDRDLAPGMKNNCCCLSRLRPVKIPFPAGLHQYRDLTHFAFVIVFANGGDHITVGEMAGGKGFF